MNVDSGAARILDEAALCLRQLHGDALDRLTVDRLIVGVFFTGVRFSDGSTGVAYTPPEMIERASTRILGDGLRSYRGRPAHQMIEPALDGPFAHVIRLAALNALSAPLFERGCFGSTTEGDLSLMPALFFGRRVCMVGAIIPLLRKIATMSPAQIEIVEKKKETQDEAVLGRFVPLDETAQALGRCQTAVLTGATVANGSIDELLGYLPGNAAVAVVGPTAGFAPTPLFRRGVAAVGTVAVTDGERAMEMLGEGCGGYQLFKNCVRKINLLNREALKRVEPPIMLPGLRD